MRGKERSFRLRHQLKTFKMLATQKPHRVRSREVRDQREQMPWMPDASGTEELQRQEFLLEILLNDEVKKKAAPFGIIWTPNCPWAAGPSIEPFAHIFDRFVIGHWRVSVSYELGPDRQAGWLFEPL